MGFALPRRVRRQPRSRARTQQRRRSEGKPPRSCFRPRSLQGGNQKKKTKKNHVYASRERNKSSGWASSSTKINGKEKDSIFKQAINRAIRGLQNIKSWVNCSDFFLVVFFFSSRIWELKCSRRWKRVICTFAFFLPSVLVAYFWIIPCADLCFHSWSLSLSLSLFFLSPSPVLLTARYLPLLFLSFRFPFSFFFSPCRQLGRAAGHWSRRDGACCRRCCAGRLLRPPWRQRKRWEDHASGEGEKGEKKQEQKPNQWFESFASRSIGRLSFFASFPNFIPVCWSSLSSFHSSNNFFVLLPSVFLSFPFLP